MSSGRDKRGNPSRSRLREQTQQLREAIARIDFVVSGHVHSRNKVCGRANCRCAVDPDARHGPYYQWSRREDGRQRNSVVTPEQARLLQEGIENLKRIKSLLGDWERISTEEILSPDED